MDKNKLRKMRFYTKDWFEIILSGIEVLMYAFVQDPGFSIFTQNAGFLQSNKAGCLFNPMLGKVDNINSLV